MEAEINTMLLGDRLEAAIATIKKTIVPHSTEPPYFTTEDGSPRPKPNPRKARPEMMIARHRQARIIKTAPEVVIASGDMKLRSACRVLICNRGLFEDRSKSV